jgi:hypothetical protein
MIDGMTERTNFSKCTGLKFLNNTISRFSLAFHYMQRIRQTPERYPSNVKHLMELTCHCPRFKERKALASSRGAISVSLVERRLS